ncbi:MAG: hypothetical protein HKN92_07215 [Chitinophagales bacterium]|nr:hypothetical protein [Chitinophagales bacterium]
MFKRNLPNYITSINLLCGISAIVSFAYLDDRLRYIPVLVLIGLVADFLDGFVARITKSASEIGKQLDSLADLVTFGVVPGLIAVYFLKSDPFQIEAIESLNLALLGLLIPVFTAWRLAKFNVDGGNYKHFKGLASPANAIYYVGLIFLPDSQFSFFIDPIFLVSAVFLLSALLVSNLPMFNMKFDNFKWKGNEIRFLYLFVVISLLLFFGLQAISLCIIAYIFMSMINNLFKNEIQS